MSLPVISPLRFTDLHLVNFGSQIWLMCSAFCMCSKFLMKKYCSIYLLIVSTAICFCHSDATNFFYIKILKLILYNYECLNNFPIKWSWSITACIFSFWGTPFSFSSTSKRFFPIISVPLLSMNPKAHNFLTDFRYFCDLSVDTRETPFSWVGERLSGCSCLLITATPFHAVYQHILVQSSVHRFWRP